MPADYHALRVERPHPAGWTESTPQALDRVAPRHNDPWNCDSPLSSHCEFEFVYVMLVSGVEHSPSRGGVPPLGDTQSAEPTLGDLCVFTLRPPFPANAHPPGLGLSSP